MSRSAPSRRRHRIRELGLSFEVDPDGALETVALDDGTIVSERLPGDAVFFVRYGQGQTLDRFLAGLGDMLTTATVVGDEAIRFVGLPAGRVTVRIDRRPVPGRGSETPSLLRVTGFVVHDVPVLVGYRMREDESAEVGDELERVVDGVEWSQPA